METVSKMVRAMVSGLVDQPERVEIAVVEHGPGRLAVQVSVAKDDLGRVIGQHGRTARALRTIVSAAGVKAGAVFQLNIVDKTKEGN